MTHERAGEFIAGTHTLLSSGSGDDGGDSAVPTCSCTSQGWQQQVSELETPGVCPGEQGKHCFWDQSRVHQARVNLEEEFVNLTTACTSQEGV